MLFVYGVWHYMNTHWIYVNKKVSMENIYTGEEGNADSFLFDTFHSIFFVNRHFTLSAKSTKNKEFQRKVRSVIWNLLNIVPSATYNAISRMLQVIPDLMRGLFNQKMSKTSVIIKTSLFTWNSTWRKICGIFFYV